MTQYYNIDSSKLAPGDIVAPTHQEIQIVNVDETADLIEFIVVSVLMGKRKPHYETLYRLDRDEFMAMLVRMGEVEKMPDLFGAGRLMSDRTTAIRNISELSRAISVCTNPPF